MEAILRQTDQKLKDAGYKFLGWMNGWSLAGPAEHAACRESGHFLNTVDDNQSCDHSISCDICKIYWKYDSSD